MRFSVVDSGYDCRQVDSCLDELGVRLTRLAARAEAAAGTGREWDQIRQEATLLRGLVDRSGLATGGAPASARRDVSVLEREAAEILARARGELDAAREEARQVRERVYAEAVRARREFEAALHERRRREARADRILAGVPTAVVPAETPTAAASAGGVPATRIATGTSEVSVERPEPGTRVA
ncbi:ATPase [Micromonospora sp. KC213]|uniref:ATPase n=1 Tax=Micromonospora sp. KC213 TaxID=2530378 RepID=UPI001043FCBB|nr:ATPase [Micromonospora sp. KC213]TDC29153.1 ATPase [Micromonospora sp. KC213]